MRRYLVLFTLIFTLASVITVNAASNSQFIITEVMPNPSGSDTKYEWIELTNFSNAQISLENITINGYQLPVGIVQPEEIIVLVRDVVEFESRYNTNAKIYKATFSLANSGATIDLFNSLTSYTSQFTYPQAEEEKSFELLTGTCERIELHHDSNSLGILNTPCITSTPIITPTTVPSVEIPIYISAIYPAPIDSSETEWIELSNLHTSDAILTNWVLKDKKGSEFLLSDVSINSGSTKIIYPTGVSLNNDGDTIYLVSPTGSIVDIFIYGASKKGDIFSIMTHSSTEISTTKATSTDIKSSEFNNSTNNSNPTTVEPRVESQSSSLTMPKIYYLKDRDH